MQHSVPGLITHTKPLTTLFELTQLSNMHANFKPPSTPSFETTPSNPRLTSTQPTKDFSAAFAMLQLRYGTEGHVPSPMSVDASFVLDSSMDMDIDSDDESISTTSPSSTVSPARPPTPHPAKKRRAVKDYSAALGDLQSRYGMGGFVSTPQPPTSQTPLDTPFQFIFPSSASLASTSTAASREPLVARKQPASTKNFEVAFGTLNSRYGMGGCAPIPKTASSRTAGDPQEFNGGKAKKMSFFPMKRKRV
ncbi:hypothetical protein BDQ12DRAFT_719065 [Crucibulum laeve]|uniref:Uncharacterized protein n=1 Tax=Crucibulum laeve TaxID=68775 RepID=A0A5C3MHN1_9AGAR|nr:hypothetical protein BDQ12DRAFT_719065 [Crucibulum laeve]